MSSHLKLSFRRMGAELDINDLARGNRFSIDVRNTKEGERFLISGRDLGREDIKILDVDPENRHLLLMWRERETGTKHKFLAGHDERHWFVAAVPEQTAISPKGQVSAVKNVRDAMEALKPAAVRDREHKLGLKGPTRHERHNQARKRQGEWFFIPAWSKLPKNVVALKNEPIMRNARSKPHKCEFLARVGGTQVWVCSKYPTGVSDERYRQIRKENPEAKKWFWTQRVADAKVYVKGKISHPDHATLDLGPQWHEVLMNRESEAPSMRHVRFLD